MLVIRKGVVEYNYTFAGFKELAEMLPFAIIVRIGQIVQHQNVTIVTKLLLISGRMRVHRDIEVSVSLEHVVERNLVRVAAVRFCPKEVFGSPSEVITCVIPKSRARRIALMISKVP